MNRGFDSKIWLSALLGLGCLILGLGMVRGESTIQDYMELSKSREILKNTVDDLQNENSNLSEEIVKLKKSPSYAKKILRDKYHVTEKDENIIFFTE